MASLKYMSHSYTTFTSESVSAGHPDKLCDQISDAVLDKALSAEPKSRVACETLIKTVGKDKDKRTKVIIAGETKPACDIDYDTLARAIFTQAGYGDPRLGIDFDALEIVCLMGEQSDDISSGVDKKESEDQGAGDQGMMFGYACRETDSYMPAPIDFAHRLMRCQNEVREAGELPLGPDAKAQVTVRYDKGQPKHIDTVVLSTQHTHDATLDELKPEVKKHIIEATLPAHLLTDETRYLINPAGRFEIGGPEGDCGLTGRKIIVDSYGGYVRHGGGAFSGKDPSKVDRSGAYAARYIAKNIVAAHIAERCEVQVSYAIGDAEPVSIEVDTFGTSDKSNEEIKNIVLNSKCFDVRPAGIIKMLDLERPIYLPTATYGHFGRDDYRSEARLFPWERCDKVEDILKSQEESK